jgi:predicted phage terminase large subunit-like protein
VLSGEQLNELHGLPVGKVIEYWDALEKVGRDQGKLPQVVRMLVLSDLYYLLVRVCGRVDMLPRAGDESFVRNQFAFERCREVQRFPDGYVDLWSREHWKSSVVTFGLTIQTILANPEVTIGIFSHTRPIAKAFLRQIMREFESNRVLHTAFPDILWGEDVRPAPKWSEDDGIIIKRKTNPKEATIEAWGLVDGQPTSKHYQVMLYDDIVVAGSVTNPEMIEKTMTALEQSYNLMTAGGVRRFVGTRWHFNDAYRTVIDRGTARPREYPGRKGGDEDGESILWSDELHRQKRRDMGPYTYAAQILLNPKADALQGFRREWLRYYDNLTEQQIARMNVYILVDSANSKRKESDYTAMWAVGLSEDQNYYVLDIVRDRLNLVERAQYLFDLHRKWKPVQVRWEQYGLMADIQHIKTEQSARCYRFEIKEVAGRTSKDDRIKRLLPLFEQGKIYLPRSLRRTNYEKVMRDLVRDFVEDEYMAFPVSGHKDMMDSLARICEPDLPLVWPRGGKSAGRKSQFADTEYAMFG